MSIASFGYIRIVGRYFVLLLFCLLGLGAIFIGSPQKALAKGFTNSVSSDAASNTSKVKRTRIAAKAIKASHNKSKRSYKLRSRNKFLNGPLLIVASLSEQRVHVYKAGIRIASSKISSGQFGHRTPTGIFTILQRKRRHYSNIYRGAPMPYMQRITWSGIALHAGLVPNYPASHGCIRLPKQFARKLYSQTRIGDHVIIGHKMSVPKRIQHSFLFQPTTIASLSQLSLRKSTNEQENLLHKSTQSLKVNQERQDDLIAPTYRIAHRNSFYSEKLESSDLFSGDRIRKLSIKLMDIETNIFRKQLIAQKIKSPLRIFITQKTEKNRIENAQRMLNQLGFDSGIPDGVVGKRTMQAVQIFQATYGLKIDGVLSDPILKRIGLAAGNDLTNNGYIYIRQKYKDILKAEVKIKKASGPLGTHLFSAMDVQENLERIGWTALTITERTAAINVARKGLDVWKTPAAKKESSSSEVLSRVDLPGFVKTFISDRLTPGSSLIISDNGKSHETSKYTNFIVLTR